ncbi:unnamed protein product, partial [Adineta ricciae]
MACSKAEDLINQLIEATLKLLEFGLNIMDALRVQKLLTIRNQKIGLISDDACLPECSLRFSLNFDLMMFNKLLRNACLRARATLNELRVCRLRYPNAPLVLEPKTKVKFQKLQRKIQEFDEAVRSDKMIARRDLRDFREISIIFSQLEHDLKLLICSLECASTMKDTVLFAAPITDVMTVLSIVLSRLERLAQKAEIDEKIAAAEQQKALQEQKVSQTNSTTPLQQKPSATRVPKNRTNEALYTGRNTNRTSQQRRQDMTAMIAAASQQRLELNHEKLPVQTNTLPTTQSERSLKGSYSNDINSTNDNKHNGKLPRHINRHHSSIKSNVLQQQQKENVTSDEIRLDHRQVKQFRHDFIKKWTDDARQIYAQSHLIRSSNISSTPAVRVDFENNHRHRAKSTHHHYRHHRSSFLSSSSSSSLVPNNSKTSSSIEDLRHAKTKACSSNSTSLPSAIENQSNIKQQQQHASSNNSAHVQRKSNDNIE